MSGEGDDPNKCDVCGELECTGHSPPAPIDKIRFALAIPTCAEWRPERAASLEKLRTMLGHRPEFYREFREKAANWIWSRDLWRWGCEMGARGATHLLQLQDDVRPSPRFWSSLRAMVEANPERVIGLQTNHPVARSLAFQGRRWMKTRAWLVGCQYVFPLQGPDSLAEFIGWLNLNESRLTKHQREHEDVTISTWLAATGRDCWHPIPAIADVDLAIGSTYETTPGHIDDHRRPTVTWHGYREEELTSPDWWQVPDNVELYPGPGLGLCTACGLEPAVATAPNFVALGRLCAVTMVGQIMGVKLQLQAAT